MVPRTGPQVAAGSAMCARPGRCSVGRRAPRSPTAWLGRSTGWPGVACL